MAIITVHANGTYTAKGGEAWVGIVASATSANFTFTPAAFAGTLTTSIDINTGQGAGDPLHREFRIHLNEGDTIATPAHGIASIDTEPNHINTN